MTRFMWWFAIYYGVSIVCDAIRWHFSGGYQAYHAQFSKDVVGLASLLNFVLFFVFWFGIVSKE